MPVRVLLIAALALFLPAAPAAAAELVLDNRQDSAAPGEPFDLVSGELTGDGRTDLAYPDRAGNRVVVLPGDGATGFGGAEAFATGARPVAIAAGDLNGDGRTDLVTANGNHFEPTTILAGPDGSGGGSSVTVALKNPGAGFATSTLALGANPYSVAIGQLDGGAGPEIAVATTSGVRILDNNGAGGFVLGAAYNVPGAERELAVADFDGNGLSDVVVATDTALFRALQTTAGAFSAFAQIGPNRERIADLAVADFDGNGRRDLAVADYQTPGANGAGGAPSGRVATLLQDAGGAFALGQELDLDANSPFALDAGDVDKDGKVDVLAGPANIYPLSAGAGGEAKLSLLRNPSGTGTALVRRNLLTSGSARGAAFADLDGDGALELTAAHSNSSISVFRSKPRTFVEPFPSLLFGAPNLGSSSTRTATVVNNAVAPARFAGFELSGPQGGDYRIAAGSCNTSTPLGADERCTLEIEFTPRAAGERVGTLIAVDNDIQGRGATTLQGFGALLTADAPGSGGGGGDAGAGAGAPRGRLVAGLTLPATQKIRDVVLAGLRVQATCTPGCTLKVLAEHRPKAKKRKKGAKRRPKRPKPIVVARGSDALRSGGATTLLVDLTRAGKKVVRRARKLPVTVTLEADPIGGGASVLTRKRLTLVR